MKTNPIYLCALVALINACTAEKRIKTHTQAQKPDVKKHLAYEEIILPYYHPDGRSHSVDTIPVSYFYNADNTLDYRVYCQHCGEQFQGYVSKYYYRFDTLRKRVEITGLYYERCSDYPVKHKRIYNIKGRQLEEWYWEVYKGWTDSTCKSRDYNAPYNVFDTSWISPLHELRHKWFFKYNMWGKVRKVFVEEFSYEKNNKPDIYQTNLYGVSFDEHKKGYCLYYTYLCNNRDEEDDYTIWPYLEALKLEKKIK